MSCGNIRFLLLGQGLWRVKTEWICRLVTFQNFCFFFSIVITYLWLMRMISPSIKVNSECCKVISGGLAIDLEPHAVYFGTVLISDQLYFKTTIGWLLWIRVQFFCYCNCSSNWTLKYDTKANFKFAYMMHDVKSLGWFWLFWAEKYESRGTPGWSHGYLSRTKLLHENWRTLLMHDQFALGCLCI